MKWIGDRTSFVDGKDRTTIIIDAGASGFTKAIMGAWFAMWITIGSTVIWSYFYLNLTSQEKLILIIFMTFWVYFAIRVGRSFFWNLWGKELIKIDEVKFTYKKSIKSFGRANEYFLENIEKIRTYQPEERSLQNVWESSFWIRGGERLEFDYMGKVIRFGRKLEEKDAQLLFKFISKKVETRVRKLK